MHLKPWIATAWLALLALCPTVAKATPTRCVFEKIHIIGANQRDMVDVCAGVGRALDFFAAHGLELRDGVTLEITPKLPPWVPTTAAGVYLAQDRKIFMLPYAEFRKFKTWFKIPINRDIYQSLAAHEMAHAITEANFQMVRPSIHAREYLAYVALFSTMTPSLRERTLHAIPGKGFEDEDRISFIIYMFDPMYFGAQAYRHYLNLHDRTSFLRSILAGKALME
jgi:hypothetical protein